MTNRDHPILLIEEMKVTNVLRVKCELVAGIAKGIAMTLAIQKQPPWVFYKNRYFLKSI